MIRTREEAAAWAAGVRERRAGLVADVASGLGLDAVIDRLAADDDLAATHVLVVAQAIPGLGKVGSRRRLADLGVDESDPIGDVSIDALRSVWEAGGA